MIVLDLCICFTNLIMSALLTCFAAVTMDSWSEVMWWTMDGYQPIAGGIFFIILLVSSIPVRTSFCFGFFLARPGYFLAVISCQARCTLTINYAFRYVCLFCRTDPLDLMRFKSELCIFRDLLSESDFYIFRSLCLSTSLTSS